VLSDQRQLRPRRHPALYVGAAAVAIGAAAALFIPRKRKLRAEAVRLAPKHESLVSKFWAAA